MASAANGTIINQLSANPSINKIVPLRIDSIIVLNAKVDSLKLLVVSDISNITPNVRLLPTLAPLPTTLDPFTY